MRKCFRACFVDPPLTATHFDLPRMLWPLVFGGQFRYGDSSAAISARCCNTTVSGQAGWTLWTTPSLRHGSLPIVSPKIARGNGKAVPRTMKPAGCTCCLRPQTRIVDLRESHHPLSVRPHVQHGVSIASVEVWTRSAPLGRCDVTSSHTFASRAGASWSRQTCFRLLASIIRFAFSFDIGLTDSPPVSRKSTDSQLAHWGER